jgi:hypothetical protein
VPAYNPANSDMVGWAGETTLDVEYAHTVAPGANILLVETPVSETEGVHGFPQIVTAEEYVLKHHLGDVISQSFSATEQTFPRRDQALRGAYQLADHHVTVLTASGDSGAADVGLDQSHLLPVPGDVVAGQRPAGDRRSAGPSCTSLRGPAHRAPTCVERHLQQDDQRVRRRQRGPEPAGQRRRQVHLLHPARLPERRARTSSATSRGVPDISMSAACNGAVDTYAPSAARRPAGPRSAAPARPRRCSRASWRWPTRWPATRSG